MLGEAGSKINLRVLRAGDKAADDHRAARQLIKFPPSEAQVEDGKIGVIKVYSLENGEVERHSRSRSGFGETGRAENRA